MEGIFPPESIAKVKSSFPNQLIFGMFYKPYDSPKERVDDFQFLFKRSLC